MEYRYPCVVTAGRMPSKVLRAPSPKGDLVSAETRSRIMRAVGQRDTSAEIAVRRLLHGIGVRFRVGNRDLPGSPDIANRTRRWAVFVNGCFWHGHKNCPKTKSKQRPRVPESNRIYWALKFFDNRQRDARKCREMRMRGFEVAIVWDCELSDLEGLRDRLRRFIAHAMGGRSD